MPGTHRTYGSRRAKKRSGKRLAVAGAMAGVLGMGAVAVGIVVLRPGDDGPGTSGPGAVQGGVPAPRTGPVIKVTTPEGYGYSMAAVKRGATPAASGGTATAFAEYVLTNTTNDPVLLDFPVDLFVRRNKVPAESAGRCMPQPGADADMCTLPNTTKIVSNLDGSASPTAEDGGDRMMPAGGSYLVRVTTDVPVAAGTQSADLKLYVWNVRFIPDRKAVEIVPPSP